MKERDWVSLWPDVVRAVEEALPVYEQVSEAISIFKARYLRNRAASDVKDSGARLVLDVGTGPGTSTRMLLSKGIREVVGIDVSVRLLRFAKGSISPLTDDQTFHPVVAVSENLPFRAEAFDALLTCFALRDARDVEGSLREYERILPIGGLIVVVDIGKPHPPFKRMLASFYVEWLMPVVARLLVMGRLSGNPFRMIVPTFRRLPPNSKLQELAHSIFGAAVLEEHLLGGLIVLKGWNSAKRVPCLKFS